MEHLGVCLKFVVLCLIVLKAEEPSGEWSLYSTDRLQDEGVCNIDVLDRSQLSHQQFIERYAYRRPVILRGLTDNTKFRFLCSKASLLTQFGDRTVELSTANTHSYKKVYVTFREYVGGLLRPQAPEALGSETLYFFGGNNVTEWNSLFQHYESPPYVLPHSSRAYSFGVAGQTAFLFSPFSRDFQIISRLSAHVRHMKISGNFAPQALELEFPFTGTVLDLLRSSEREPHFDRNRTTLSWVTEVYPNLPEDEAPLECTLRPQRAANAAD